MENNKTISMEIPSNIIKKISAKHYKNLGFQIINLDNGFYKVTLPVNWEIVFDYKNQRRFLTDGAKNNRGVYIGGVKPELKLYTRLGIGIVPSEHYFNHDCVCITDSISPFKRVIGSVDPYESKSIYFTRKFQQEGEDYLDKFYPDWRNPVAYWEVEDLEQIRSQNTMIGKVKKQILDIVR